MHWSGSVLIAALVVAGTAICSGATYPDAEDFEAGCESRWRKVDGTYWRLSNFSATGKTGMSRVLFPAAKVSGRPMQLTAAEAFPVSGDFDMSVRSSVSGEEGMPIKARVDLLFVDASGKLVKQQEYMLNSGYRGNMSVLCCG